MLFSLMGCASSAHANPVRIETTGARPASVVLFEEPPTAPVAVDHPCEDDLNLQLEAPSAWTYRTVVKAADHITILLMDAKKRTVFQRNVWCPAGRLTRVEDRYACPHADGFRRCGTTDYTYDAGHLVRVSRRWGRR